MGGWKGRERKAGSGEGRGERKEGKRREERGRVGTGGRREGGRKGGSGERGRKKGREGGREEGRQGGKLLYANLGLFFFFFERNVRPEQWNKSKPVREI